MRPVCVKCKVEMRCEKNEHGVELVGCENQSFRFFSGDRYGCPSCGQQIVVGFSRGMDSHEDGYDERVAYARTKLDDFTVIGGAS